MMAMNLPRAMKLTLPRDNKLSCEREVTLANYVNARHSLLRSSSLSRVHVNRPSVEKVVLLLCIQCTLIMSLSLRCLLSRENLNSTAITFDALDRFQENKVCQTAQTMNNILRSNTKW